MKKLHPYHRPGPNHKRAIRLLANGWSVAYVADKLGVTRQRVYQYIAKERNNGRAG